MVWSAVFNNVTPRPEIIHEHVEGVVLDSRCIPLEMSLHLHINKNTITY